MTDIVRTASGLKSSAQCERNHGDNKQPMALQPEVPVSELEAITTARRDEELLAPSSHGGSAGMPRGNETIEKVRKDAPKIMPASCAALLIYTETLGKMRANL